MKILSKTKSLVTFVAFVASCGLCRAETLEIDRFTLSSRDGISAAFSMDSVYAGITNSQDFQIRVWKLESEDNWQEVWTISVAFSVDAVWGNVDLDFSVSSGLFGLSEGSFYFYSWAESPMLEAGDYKVTLECPWWASGGYGSGSASLSFPADGSDFYFVQVDVSHP